MAYGRDFARYARVVDVDVLNIGQRFHVFGQTIRRNDLGPIESAWLLAMLAVGALCYDFMRRTGRSPQVVPSGA
jgi:hypothetical protein